MSAKIPSPPQKKKKKKTKNKTKPKGLFDFAKFVFDLFWFFHMRLQIGILMEKKKTNKQKGGKSLKISYLINRICFKEFKDLIVPYRTLTIYEMFVDIWIGIFPQNIQLIQTLIYKEIHFKVGYIAQRLTQNDHWILVQNYIKKCYSKLNLWISNFIEFFEFQTLMNNRVWNSKIKLWISNINIF